jgi:hypothetical protein
VPWVSWACGAKRGGVKRARPGAASRAQRVIVAGPMPNRSASHMLEKKTRSNTDRAKSREIAHVGVLDLGIPGRPRNVRDFERVL